MPDLLRYPSLYERYMAEIRAEDRQRAERAAVIATVRQFQRKRPEFDLSAPAVRVDLVRADA
jgi:hypothetical protein